MSIIVGHELIHASHSMDGTNDKTKDEYGIFRNEEMRTIGDGFTRQGDITETMLRKELGLPSSSVERNY